MFLLLLQPVEAKHDVCHRIFVDSFSSMLLAVQLWRVRAETLLHWSSQAWMCGQVFCVFLSNAVLFGQSLFFASGQRHFV